MTSPTIPPAPPPSASTKVLAYNGAIGGTGLSSLTLPATSESFQQAVAGIIFGRAEGSVPEPTTLALLAISAASLLIRRRNRK